MVIGHNLEVEVADVDAHPSLQLPKQFRRKALQQLAAEVVRNVQQLAILGSDVDVSLHIRVEAGGVAVAARCQPTGQPALGEGIQRVVDGGQADAGVRGLHHVVELLGRRMGGGAGEGGVDNLALAGAPQVAGAEDLTDFVEGRCHGVTGIMAGWNLKASRNPPCIEAVTSGVETPLLCENCGYELEGRLAMTAGARCPECGKPTAESLPEARRGTPWQQKPGFFSWGVTVWRTLMRPRRTYGQLSMSSRGFGFLGVNLLVSSSLMVAPVTGLFIGDFARAARGKGAWPETLAYLGSFGLHMLLVGSMLFFVTLFDVYGIGLLARARGWRLTREAAWTVCNQASAAWLLSGALPLLFMANYYVLNTLVKLPFTGQVSNAAGMPRMSWQEALGVWLPIVGYLSGLLAFEVLALRGARVCRYANLPRSEGEGAPA
jgi:hypothetical protein